MPVIVEKNQLETLHLLSTNQEAALQGPPTLGS